jgi:NCS1 family nucleobase:cation symporter-1
VNSKETSDLYNADLAPTTAAQRTWHWYHFAALWVGMVMCIPAYTLAASLVEGGMSAMQASLTVLLANTIILVPMLLIGHAGTKYGIPYAVLARAAFGTTGAKLPALMRAIVACGWYCWATPWKVTNCRGWGLIWRSCCVFSVFGRCNCGLWCMG